MFQFTFHETSFAHKVDFASSPGDEFYKHMHPFFEVIYLVEGTVDFHVEGNTYQLNIGDILLIQPGKYHFAMVNRNNRYERYVLKLPESLLPKHVAFLASSIGARFNHCEAILPLFQDLDRYAEIYEKEDLYSLCLAKIIEIIVTLSKHPEASSSEVGITTIAQEITAYIEQHLSEHLTLNSIASALHYSPSYVATMFKTEMHVPLMQYIRSKKIHASLALISHGMKPQEAASAMGFADYSTFYRCYLKILGKRPSEIKMIGPSPEED